MHPPPAALSVRLTVDGAVVEGKARIKCWRRDVGLVDRAGPPYMDLRRASVLFAVAWVWGLRKYGDGFGARSPPYTYYESVSMFGRCLYGPS